MNTAVSYPAKKERYFKTSPQFAQPDLNIDAKNGIIKNASVVTAGEAEGHGIYLDQNFVEDVVRLGNEYKQGLKSRFGHPTLSNEALGTYLGRFKNFRVNGNKAVADLYLDDVAKKSPGDPYSQPPGQSQVKADEGGEHQPE